MDQICILITKVLLIAAPKLCDLQLRIAFLSSDSHSACIFVFMHDWCLRYTAQIYVNVVVPYKSTA